jgi:PAS domain S-box-containing protein
LVSRSWSQLWVSCRHDRSEDTGLIHEKYSTLGFFFQKLLKASEDRFQEIIEKTPAGVCITNEKGIYEYVNDAYCKIYGYRADELLGKHFTIVVPKEYKSKLIELHDQFLKEETEIRGEWEVLDKKGEKLFILADAAYIIDKDNKPKKSHFCH